MKRQRILEREEVSSFVWGRARMVRKWAMEMRSIMAGRGVGQRGEEFGGNEVGGCYLVFGLMGLGEIRA
jgi:hypothetical protein